MFIKDLAPGQPFRYNGAPTVYTMERQRVQDGYAVTTYLIPTSGHRGILTTNSLSTVEPVPVFGPGF
jgi:hypothetical protein